jgi:hypothetical protein
VFNGNIYQLLNQGTVLVNNPLLSLLHEQFNRLSELEKGIVYLLAIEQQLVSFNELRFLSKFFVSSASELITLLQSLKRRSLLEDLDTEGNEMTYTLPPVVMKHAITQLVEQVCQELLVVFETSPIQQLGLLRTHCFMKDVQPQEATQMPQLRFILSPIVDRLQRAWKGEVDLQEKLNEILSMLEGKASQQVGHARINIQNLLKLIEDEPR